MFYPNTSIGLCDLYFMFSDIKAIGCIIMMIWVLRECWSPMLDKAKCLCSMLLFGSLYHEHPFKPHFYIAKLGYAGVYLFFLFLLQNIDCGYSLEPPRRGGSNVYPQSMF